VSAGTVIVGGGQAGAQLAISLRELGYSESITLVGDEPYAPYSRPPLSKEYMAGRLTDDELAFRTPEYYRERDIELITGVSATSIVRESRQVVLSSGRKLAYERLVMATGARNRRLTFEGGEPSNVHYLRSREDAKRLRSALAEARDVLIIGAGFIGLEFASVAAVQGARVTVVEMADRVMGRAVSEETSAYFGTHHNAAGAEVLCSTSIDEYQRDESGRVTGVRIGTEARTADLVLVGIGVMPNSELAEDAGLAVDNGIIVDAGLTTCDPAISAIGDCARHPRPDSPTLVRVESVQNAADQARFLARRITGVDAEYGDVPWFWSHQAGDKLQIAGLSQPTDRSFILGDPSTRRFSVCRVREGHLVAVESINSPGDHLASRKLLASGTRVTEAQLRTPGFGFSTRTTRPALVTAASSTHPTNHR
jgi:3-phenylpropionate/trans-cinnamate dioxygenase ferredoxin reductase subunit